MSRQHFSSKVIPINNLKLRQLINQRELMTTIYIGKKNTQVNEKIP